MRNLVLELGERLFDVRHKRRTAAAGQYALLGQLLSLGIRNHIRAQSGLDHAVEAQLLERGDYLTQLGIAELTGYGRRDDGVYLVLFVVLTAAQNVYCVQYVRLVTYRAERALIYARAARYALIVINMRYIVLAAGNGLYLAGLLTGAYMARNRAVRTHRRALAALLALGGIDARLLVLVKRDRTRRTRRLTTVRNTAAAVHADFITAYRTFVTCDRYYLNHVGLVLMTAHGKLYAFLKYRAFLVYAAAHRGLGAGSKLLGYVDITIGQIVGIGMTRYFAQYLIFKLLDIGVKNTHKSASVIICRYIPLATQMLVMGNFVSRQLKYRRPRKPPIW